MPDGCYFVNCMKGDERRSAIAYYRHIDPNGGNDNHRPDAFAYTPSSPGGFTHREDRQGHVDLNGTKFTWNIESDPPRVVGQATVKTVYGLAFHGFQGPPGWNIHKDTVGKFLCTRPDGFACYRIYYAS